MREFLGFSRGSSKSRESNRSIDSILSIYLLLAAPAVLLEHLLTLPGWEQLTIAE